MTIITADEFVNGIVDFDNLSTSTQTDLLAYYLTMHAGQQMTASALASLREDLHLSPHTRLPQYLSKNSKKRPGQAPKYLKKAKGYALERSQSKLLEAAHLGRPAAKHVSASLRGTLADIGD